MIILKIAFRNIFRHKRRSILTGIMMAGGCFLFSVFIGLADGTYGNIIDMFTRDYTGHIQIHKSGYLNKPSLYNVIHDPESLGQRIQGMRDVESWAPRIRMPALAFAGIKTMGIEVIGIDPLRESKTTRLKVKVNKGRFISDKAMNEIIISGSLAKILKVGVDGEVALISQGADGSIANDLFTVVGITDSDSQGYGSMRCFMHIETAQIFLALEGRAHEIAIVLTEHTRSRQVAGSIKEGLSDPSLDVSPWEVIEGQFYKAMQADLEGNWISIIILTIIIAMGVFNTVLMVVLERTREFGVLRAVGTRTLAVFQLIVLETAFLAVISIIIGATAGILANYLLATYGIDYPTPIEYGGVMFKEITAKVTFRSVVMPSAIVFFTAILVSVLPAIRAARIVPVKALRD